MKSVHCLGSVQEVERLKLGTKRSGAWLPGNEISVVWYFISLTSHFYSCLQLLGIHGTMEIATKPNYRSQSSTPRRAEHTPANFSNNVNPFLGTYYRKCGALS